MPKLEIGLADGDELNVNLSFSLMERKKNTGEEFFSVWL